MTTSTQTAFGQRSNIVDAVTLPTPHVPPLRQEEQNLGACAHNGTSPARNLVTEHGALLAAIVSVAPPPPPPS